MHKYSANSDLCSQSNIYIMYLPTKAEVRNLISGFRKRQVTYERKVYTLEWVSLERADRQIILTFFSSTQQKKRTSVDCAGHSIKFLFGAARSNKAICKIARNQQRIIIYCGLWHDPHPPFAYYWAIASIILSWVNPKTS